MCYPGTLQGCIPLLQGCVALRRNLLFAALDDAALARLEDAMVLRSFAAEEDVVVEGEEGMHYFLIAAGAAEVLVRGAAVLRLAAGSGFGELALLYDAPRAATVRAVGELQCWALDRNAFRGAVVAHVSERRQMHR